MAITNQSDFSAHADAACQRVAASFAFGASISLILVKALLVFRINVNWDEFHYLSQVHSAFRGEATAIFQRGHVHLFGWLPLIGGDEITQIIAARAVMICCLAVTAYLIFKLSTRWVPPRAAWIAPLSYLAASPVVKHGGSFRGDSLLAPLTVGALVILTSKQVGKRDIVLAGGLLGIAAAITVKAVLMAPLIVLLTIAFLAEGGAPLRTCLEASTKRLLLLGLASLGTVVLLLSLHALTLAEGGGQTVQGFAASASKKALLDAGFFPTAHFLLATLDADRATWLLLTFGTIVAVIERSAVAVLVASLLPLLLYRNSFPYYYVVMLAPASVVAAVGIHYLEGIAVAQSKSASSSWISIAVSAPLLLQGALNLYPLRSDSQQYQRAVISAVHQIFPRPVNYIDHSGMISSFRKVNFFMSGWGIENYRARGASFMKETMEKYQPPLLLANTPILEPAFRSFAATLGTEDRGLIEQYYVPYWGPIKVAGARFHVSSSDIARVALPFGGLYRLETDGLVVIDGVPRAHGDVIEIADAGGVVHVELPADSFAPAAGRLVWAEAQTPPLWQIPPFVSMYTGL